MRAPNFLKTIPIALLVALWMAVSSPGNTQPFIESCGFSGPHKDPCVLTIAQDGARETYEILRPIVDREQAVYERIVFRAGDQVTVQVGGCVQTGGVGRTWKRYVNPSGPNSSRLYFGRIEIREIPPSPSVPPLTILGPLRFNDPLLQGPIMIPTIIRTTTPRDGELVLHYADDAYSDNGYYAHDNGTQNQCALNSDGDSAHVTITIDRAHPQSLTRLVPPETGKDWDLVENLEPFKPGEYDDNGLFFNPRWRWQRPLDLFPGAVNIPTFDREHPRRDTTQPITEDRPTSVWKHVSAVCKDTPVPVFGALERLWGHFNWFDVTVKGQCSLTITTAPKLAVMMTIT